MHEDYIIYVEIALIGIILGVYLGIELERERMRQDYVYILRMRAREREDKREPN